MKLFDRIIDGYMARKGLNPNQQQNAGLLSVGGYTIIGHESQDFVKGYKTNANLYAVATFLIRKAASIPWYIYKTKPGASAKVALNRYAMLTKGIGAEGAYDQALIARKSAMDENAIDDSSKLAKLLRRPNQNQGQDQFFESIFGYKILSGEADIWGNDGNNLHGDDGPFVELQVLPTQYVDLYNDHEDLYGVKGYRFNVGKGIDIDKADMLLWKSWTPGFDAITREHMRGLSPVQVAWNTYLMDNNASQAMAYMQANQGAKGALSPVVINGQVSAMTAEQASAARQTVNTSINGGSNKGTIGVLARSYDYLNFGQSAADMETVKLMDLTLHQWCRVLGLPTVLFDTAHTSDNNYQNAMRDLVTNTVVPMMASLRDELNRWLIPRFKQDNCFIDFDVTALPELQRDMEKLVNSLSKAYWLAEDEKRISMNFEPKGGVYATSLVPSGLTPIENIGMDVSVPPSTDPNVGY
jgi:HK97 family phage portal protein